MKILILNGSPRKNGKISRLLHTAEKALLEKGDSVTFIDVSSIMFKPCAGCMACRSKGSCILPQDDAHSIAEEIKNCDGIIAGSPVYWGNINGQLKCLFDRLVASMMGESKLGLPLPLHKGKKAVIITSCTTPFPFNILAAQTTKAEKALKEILGYSGFKVTRKIRLAGTKGMKEVPESALKKARKCAKTF
ncbi:flavodoxin family protein [Treponema sp. UBA3813]|uniref:flavodoxin family protein n=1 Tax=Treponema sp. UBA3813 TaxID=1947715 RepID=UPI0025D15985|nr:flavodoxin family protein [Treponema sp. UBA3813]